MPLYRPKESQTAGGTTHEDHHTRCCDRRRHRRLFDAVPPDAGRLDRCDVAGARRTHVRHHVAFGCTGDQLRHGPDDGGAEEPFHPSVQGTVRRPRVSDHLPSRRWRHSPCQHAGADGGLWALRFHGARDGCAFRGDRRRGMRPPSPVDLDREPGGRALGSAGWRHRPGTAVSGAGAASAQSRGRGASPHPSHGPATTAGRHMGGGDTQG